MASTSATWADAAASFGTTMHRTAQYPRLVRSDYAECDSVVAPDGWRYSGPREGCLDAATLTTVAAVLARHTTTAHAGVAAIWEGWAGLPLSAETAAGPRLELRGDAPRSYILFDAGAKDFADERWPERAPWVDDSLWAQSPSIIWPDDHAWVLATELDFDSTLIAGSTALVQDLVRTPGLEVHALPPDADLSWDGDTVNR
ncbi:hypothetical protein [Nesterenkonia haasae]|uniref:hypothetical protein n=1 Tax=Nesterenkonia haasae TaxID=2587813 RepID=UPI001391D614|nr:hypothetical protein [Nesterenkonia haasae]NDK32525.1 hypothetical protein [Nesterenkonia haasae]